MKHIPLVNLGSFLKDKELDIQTGPFGTQLKASDYSSHGTPVINVRNIGFRSEKIADLEYLNEAHSYRLRQHRLEKNDIAFGRKGAVDRHLIIKEKQNGWIQGSDCIRIRIKSRLINPDFLSFFFLTGGHRSWMEIQGSFGATMGSLNQGIIERISFPLFPLPIQRKIAAVLSAYDDLIENNTRRIAILEKMAEELYREWFVRLRFPGHEKTKIVKGVPEGWELRPFIDLVIKNPSLKCDLGLPKPYVGMDSLSTTSMIFYSDETRLDNSGSKFQNDDTLFPRITPCLENGKRGFVMTLGEGEIAIGSTEFIVFRSKILPSEFIYFVTCQDAFRKNAEISMVGASGRQRVQENCFNFFLVNTPPNELLSKFTAIVKPIFSQIRNHSLKQSTLARARDRLLSRLMSGKIDLEYLDIHFPPSMREEEVAHA